MEKKDFNPGKIKITLPPREEGAEFPPCFGKLHLLKDITHAPYILGRVCRFIFSDKEYLDFG